MKYSAFLFILTAFLSLNACTSGDSEQNSETNDVNPRIENMHAQVMEYHDEVMPEMESLYQLKSDLEAAADSLEGPLADSLRQTAQQLEEADAAMMGWMRQFSSQLASDDTTAAAAYYEEQLEKVKVMRDEVVSALEAGRTAKARLSN